MAIKMRQKHIVIVGYVLLVSKRTYIANIRSTHTTCEGIIGCTTAYYLTRHPRFDSSIYSITIIEATKIANGASGNAGGLLASWAYSNKLAGLSFELHEGGKAPSRSYAARVGTSAPLWLVSIGLCQEHPTFPLYRVLLHIQNQVLSRRHAARIYISTPLRLASHGSDRGYPGDLLQ